jgi:hypothetical protein
MGLGMTPSQAAGCPPHRAEPWYRAYMEALFEPDPKRIPERIQRAEQLIVTRARQMVPLCESSAESRALNAALHALRALGMCTRS